MPEFVTVRHPDITVPARIPRSALPYLGDGWVVDGDGPAPTTEPALEPAPEAATGPRDVAVSSLPTDQSPPAAVAGDSPTTDPRPARPARHLKEHP